MWIGYCYFVAVGRHAFLIGIVPFIVYFSVRCIVDLADFLPRGAMDGWILSGVYHLLYFWTIARVMNLAVYSG